MRSQCLRPRGASSRDGSHDRRAGGRGREALLGAQAELPRLRRGRGGRDRDGRGRPSDPPTGVSPSRLPRARAWGWASTASRKASAGSWAKCDARRTAGCSSSSSPTRAWRSDRRAPSSPSPIRAPATAVSNWPSSTSPRRRSPMTEGFVQIRSRGRGDTSLPGRSLSLSGTVVERSVPDLREADLGLAPLETPAVGRPLEEVPVFAN